MVCDSHDRMIPYINIVSSKYLGCFRASSGRLVGVHRTEADQDSHPVVAGGSAEEGGHRTDLNEKNSVSICREHNRVYEKVDGIPERISTRTVRPIVVEGLLTLRVIASLALTVALRRLTVALTLRGVLLTLWRLAVALSCRWLSVGGTARGTAISRTSGRSVTLLVLGIVARVDRTEEQLQDPHVGGEVDRGVCTGHLLLLVLKIYVGLAQTLTQW